MPWSRRPTRAPRWPRWRIDKPDLVLLDLGLPDRDGLELLPLLVRAPGPAVIVLTAREATDEKVTALDLGADDYVTKPFDTEELLARVRSACAGRRAPRPSASSSAFRRREHRSRRRAG